MQRGIPESKLRSQDVAPIARPKNDCEVQRESLDILWLDNCVYQHQNISQSLAWEDAFDAFVIRLARQCHL